MVQVRAMRMEGFKKLPIGEDMLRVIEKDDSNSSVTTDSEEAGRRGPSEPFCAWLARLLDIRRFQVAIVVLVIVNCLIVIAELLIDLRVFEASREESDANVESGVGAARILRYVSVGLLGLFVIEMVAKAIAGRREFIQQLTNVFDVVVVTVTFALSAAFIGQEGLQSGVGLIIILRLWRIAKILNGMVASVKAKAERHLARERRTREAVEKELAKFRDYCTAQEREIDYLQGLLRRHQIKFHVIERPVVGSTIDVVVEVNEMSSEKLQAELEARERDAEALEREASNGEEVDDDRESLASIDDDKEADEMQSLNKTKPDDSSTNSTGDENREKR